MTKFLKKNLTVKKSILEWVELVEVYATISTFQSMALLDTKNSLIKYADKVLNSTTVTTYISRWASQIQSWWHLAQNWWHCRWWSCYDHCFQPSRIGWHACSNPQEDFQPCGYAYCLKSRYPQPIELWREDSNWKSHTRKLIFHPHGPPAGLVILLKPVQLK